MYTNDPDPLTNKFPKVEIPPMFYSDLTGDPFYRCSVCDGNLMENDAPYLIEKAYKRYENFTFQNTVFEYAICMPCAHAMNENMSKESLANVELYFRNNARLDERTQRFFEQGTDYNWEDGMAGCLIKGIPTENCEEYQIYAQCYGHKMLVTVMPFVLSGIAMDEISTLLSAETLGEIDDFMGNFGVPSELRDLFSKKPVLIF